MPAKFKGYIRAFLNGYTECAVWSSTNEDGASLEDRGLSHSDLTDQAVRIMRDECAEFVWENRHDLVTSGLSPDRAGHDFWLSRNGHGAGFFDEGADPVFRELQRAAKWAGTCDLYVNDAEQIDIA